jgi:hypothetical protein
MDSMRRARRIAVVVMSLALAGALLATTVSSADIRRPTTSTSTFHLNPGKDRVDVAVDMTVTNRMPNTASVGPCAGSPGRTCRNTTRWFVDDFGYFWIQAGARNVKFTGPGVKAQIHSANDGFTNYIVNYSPIWQGQSRTFRVSYNVPAARPRSPNTTRITEAYAHFCWHGQPTDRGSVTARLPRSFEPMTRFGTVSKKRTNKDLTLRAKRDTNMGRFYACTDSFKPNKLVRTETVSPSGQKVIVEGWPEDPAWTEEITAGVASTLPELESIAGTPIPGDEIVVRQVAAQALGGYAGDFDDQSDQIRVGEKYDDPMLVAHELAHAWFSTATVKDTWISEGHAEWMALQANGRACNNPGSYPGKGKPKLSDWQYLGANPSKREEKVVEYQYEAACDIVQQIEWKAGPERLTDITRALLERAPKYGGTERKKPPKPDWREWLDAVDELGLVPAGREDLGIAEQLLLKYGVIKPKQVKGRVEARGHYHEALAGPWGEYMPIAVRDLMDDWHFDKAMKAWGTTERALEEAAASDEAVGGDILGQVGPLLREARTIDELRQIRKRLAEDPASFLAEDALSE